MNMIYANFTLMSYCWKGEPKDVQKVLGKVLKGYSEDFRYRIESYQEPLGLMRCWQSCEEYDGSILDWPITLLHFDNIKITQSKNNDHTGLF